MGFLQRAEESDQRESFIHVIMPVSLSQVGMYWWHNVDESYIGPFSCSEKKTQRESPSRKQKAFPDLVSLLLPTVTRIFGGAEAYVHPIGQSSPSSIRHRACKMPVRSLFLKRAKLLKSDPNLSHYIHHTFFPQDLCKHFHISWFYACNSHKVLIPCGPVLARTL